MINASFPQLKSCHSTNLNNHFRHNYKATGLIFYSNRSFAMNLSSISFLLIYFPILFTIYYLPIFDTKRKNLILLCASLVLYSFAQPMYLFFLLLCIAFNYLLTKAMLSLENNILGYIGIIADILVLFFFKYHNYFASIVDSESLMFSKLLMPIGISYFTFREISLIVDCMKDKKKFRKLGFFEVALYISNFMCIVSGPLENFEDEIKQIRERDDNKQLIFTGANRISIGIIKKVMIADSISSLVDYCYSADSISIVMAWIGAIAYSIQLYFDFSGYTDIVIGVGNVFGFSLPENFNLPYCARSISDFWKRWHMSLTKWFTKYLYISLGGSRVRSKLRHIFNLWIVWIATGLWHGSSLNYLLWAMIYFVLQLLEKYIRLDKRLEKLHLNRIFTALVIIICWAIFRADSLPSALSYVGSMFGLNKNSLMIIEEFSIIKNYICSLGFGLLFSLGFGNTIKTISQKKLSYNICVKMITFFLLVGSIILLFGRGNSAPLYANF